MFSMKYEFEMKCFLDRGSQFTFTKKLGHYNIIIWVAVLLLPCQYFLVEKNLALTCVSALITILSMVVIAGYYRKESLLILNGIGVTVKKSSIWGTNSRYFDLKYIKDIVIIEAISMQSIYFQLVLIPHDHHKEIKLHPLFKDFQPCLHHLKTVYRHAQEKLIIPREKMVVR